MPRPVTGFRGLLADAVESSVSDEEVVVECVPLLLVELFVNGAISLFMLLSFI